MLMFLSSFLFMMPMVLMNSWWMVQIWMFFLALIFVFNGNFLFYFSSMGFGLGMDFLSWLMILLSFWICCLMQLSSLGINSSSYFSSLFMFMIMILIFSLFCTFSSLSLFNFYFFFEFSLIPTLMLILGWGYQPERLGAFIYLILYTLMASLPLLSSIMWLSVKLGGVCYLLIYDICSNVYLYFSLILSFLVKLPMFTFHLWLPKAHVEAPISGSMILAGVLLKLGGYGLIRVFKCLVFFSLKYNLYIISYSLYGGVVVSLICLSQVDLKMLIAYSSVAHMSLVISGLFTMNFWGLYGSIFLMVGHGLCSSGLFCLSNIVYERFGSRLFFLISGLMSYMPSLSLWWFLLIISNMSSPPTLSLIGEISIFISIMGYSSYLMYFLFALSFFSCVYSLYIYSSSQHGKFYSGMFSFSSCYLVEFHLLLLHWLPLNFFFCCYDYVL